METISYKAVKVQVSRAISTRTTIWTITVESVRTWVHDETKPALLSEIVKLLAN